MPNLPPIIPRASGMSSSFSRPTSSIGRAQQVNISKLNQQKEREAATTSIVGAIHQKEGKTNSGPTTSINRSQGNEPASTSVFHPGVSVNEIGNESEAVRDRLRFQYIRKMMRDKKEAEEASARDAENNQGLDIHTGKSLRTTGVNSLKKTLGRMYRANRTEFKAMSKDDKTLMQKIIQDKLGKKLTGSQITFRDKKNMGQEAYKNWKSGTISKETYRHIKGVISDLT